MRGPGVVDWDLEELMKEYDKGEKLTEEEERKLEEDLAKYMHDFAMNEMKDENDKLQLMVEESTRKADEETTKREKAEEEVKQGQELIEKLRRSMESMDVARVVREVPSDMGSRVDRRSRVRCWDLTRPGGCSYGARCRYLHPVEVVRAEDYMSREEGEGRILGYKEQMRRRQEQQDFPEARARVRRWREGMACQEQPMMMMNLQTRSSMMNQQQTMMNQQQQWLRMMSPMMVYGHHPTVQRWPRQ